MERRLKSKEGFTLLELLVVLGIISILSAIAVPQLSAYKKNAFVDDVKADLRNAAMFEESYFIDNAAYTDTLTNLVSAGFRQNTGVTLAITVGGGGQNFSITATHNNCGADVWTFTVTGKIVDPATPCK